MNPLRPPDFADCRIHTEFEYLEQGFTVVVDQDLDAAGREVRSETVRPDFTNTVETTFDDAGCEVARVVQAVSDEVTATETSERTCNENVDTVSQYTETVVGGELVRSRSWDSSAMEYGENGLLRRETLAYTDAGPTGVVAAWVIDSENTYDVDDRLIRTESSLDGELAQVVDLAWFDDWELRRHEELLTSRVVRNAEGGIVRSDTTTYDGFGRDLIKTSIEEGVETELRGTWEEDRWLVVTQERWVDGVLDQSRVLMDSSDERRVAWSVYHVDGQGGPLDGVADGIETRTVTCP